MLEYSPLIPYKGNHRGILKDTGFTDVREYRYYEKETRGLDLQGMLEDLRVRDIV